MAYEESPAKPVVLIGRKSPGSPWGRYRVAAILLAICCVSNGCRDGEPGPPKVILVAVDGLGRARVGPIETPILDQLRQGATTTWFADGRAVMPTVTNSNHASMVTGARAAAHGITGNSSWPRGRDAPDQPMNDPATLAMPTVFTRAAASKPLLRTALVAGKRKFGKLFSASDRQSAPGSIWVESEIGPPMKGRVGIDERTMDAALLVLARESPGFLLIALPEVDLISHSFGPRSEPAMAAVRAADSLIGRLVAHLRSAGLWERTVLLVTADHGFDATAATPERPYPPVFLGRELTRAGLSDRLLAVSDGGVAHVYLRDLDPAAGELDEGQAGALSEAARLLEGLPEVERVLSRLRLGSRPTLAGSEPDWAIDHPATGELLVVSRPGYYFVDPFHPITARFQGAHGSRRNRGIPLLITGGHPVLAGGGPPVVEPADNADVGATVLHLLGLGEPVFPGGEPVPGRFRGRVLVEALRTPSTVAWR